jgi:transposase
MCLDESDERSEPCPKCGSDVCRDPQKDRLTERIELPEKLAETWLYVIKAFWCPTCRRHVFGELPPELESGLPGPNLVSFVAALITHAHASFKGTQAVLECMGTGHVSARTLDRALNFSSDSIAGAVDGLREAVSKQRVVNVDETGLKQNGRQTWVWTFVCAAFTFFRVSVSRTREALREVMTLDFTGVLGSDHFGAYNKYFNKNPKAAAQKCHAHLRREFTDLAETYVGDVSRYGKGLPRIQDRLF